MPYFQDPDFKNSFDHKRALVPIEGVAQLPVSNYNICVHLLKCYVCGADVQNLLDLSWTIIIKNLLALLFNFHFYCIYLLNSASDEQSYPQYIEAVQILQVVVVGTHDLMYLFCFVGLKL